MKCSACEMKEEAIQALRLTVALHGQPFNFNRIEAAFAQAILKEPFVSRQTFAAKHKVSLQYADKAIGVVRRKFKSIGCEVLKNTGRGHFMEEEHKAFLISLVLHQLSAQAPFQPQEHASPFG